MRSGLTVVVCWPPSAPITITTSLAGRGPVIRPLGVTTNVIELRRVHDVVLAGLTVTAAPKQARLGCSWRTGCRSAPRRSTELCVFPA